MKTPVSFPVTPFRSERFDLRKLHYFVRIVELGSISKASAELRIAQPALSKSIRCLEFDLRTSLLERSAKGVRPTRAGEKLHEHCKIVFRQLERARMEIQGNGDRPMGAVTLGIPYSVSLILSAPLLRETLIRFPEIDLKIVEEHSAGLARHLLSNHIDMSVMVTEGNVNSAIQADEMLLEELLLVRPASGEERTNARLSLAEVVDQPLILAKGQLRTMVEERFARHSLRLAAVREIDTFSMIPKCVEAGIGHAILPAGWISAVGQPRTTSVSFEEGAMNRRLAVCQPVARPLSYASLCIKRLVREITADLVESKQWQAAQLLQPREAA